MKSGICNLLRGNGLLQQLDYQDAVRMQSAAMQGWKSWLGLLHTVVACLIQLTSAAYQKEMLQ